MASINTLPTLTNIIGTEKKIYTSFPNFVKCVILDEKHISQPLYFDEVRKLLLKILMFPPQYSFLIFLTKLVI